MAFTFSVPHRCAARAPHGRSYLQTSFTPHYKHNLLYDVSAGRKRIYRRRRGTVLITALYLVCRWPMDVCLPSPGVSLDRACLPSRLPDWAFLPSPPWPGVSPVSRHLPRPACLPSPGVCLPSPGRLLTGRHQPSTIITVITGRVPNNSAPSSPPPGAAVPGRPIAERRRRGREEAEAGRSGRRWSGTGRGRSSREAVSDCPPQRGPLIVGEISATEPGSINSSSGAF